MAKCLDTLLEDMSLQSGPESIGNGPDLKEMEVEGRRYKYFDLSQVKSIEKLPFCLRIMYESCVRTAWQTSDPDIAQVWLSSAQQILNRDQGNLKLFIFNSVFLSVSSIGRFLN